MALDITQIKKLLGLNAFSLFGLAPSYEIDQNFLQVQFLDLQKQFHPDNFVLSDTEQKELIAQLSTNINQGYTSLKNPFLRGILLLSLNNISFDLAKDTLLPQQFLLEQMDFHESIDEASESFNLAKLENLETQLSALESRTIDSIRFAFDKYDFKTASELLKQLAFYTRLENTLHNAIEHIFAE